MGLESFLVDQRDIQKRGGKCVKHPVSCLIYDMLKELGMNLEQLIVLDVTYGEGRFYGAWRPRLLLGSDIRVHRWVVEPDWFTRCPSWSVWTRVQKLGIVPDIVVVDPPWTNYNHRGRKHYYEYMALGDDSTVLEGGLITARKLGVKYLLVHYKDRIVPSGTRVLNEKYFIYVSRYLKNNEIDTNPNKTWFGILEVMG